MEKKNPLLVGILTAIPSLISTISTVIKDKKAIKEEEKTYVKPPVDIIEEPTKNIQTIVADSFKEITSGSLSLKRTLNIAGTGLIISLAVADYGTHGLTKLNLILMGLGVAYSLGMTIVTYFVERKKN